MDGDPDRAPLVGDGPGDGLADPPCGVGGELEATAIVEFLDGAHQPEIAFLDEVQERHPAIAITLRDRDHQPQVRLDEEVLGFRALVDGPFDGSALLEGNLVEGARCPAGGQLCSRVLAGFDLPCAKNLELGRQQRDASDLLQIGANGISRLCIAIPTCE